MRDSLPTILISKFLPSSVGLIGWMFCFLKIVRVGIEFPTIEVRFEQLNVEADVHVGSRALPTVVNFTLNMVEVTL